jgi:hypothetical protein
MAKSDTIAIDCIQKFPLEVDLFEVGGIAKPSLTTLLSGCVVRQPLLVVD